MALLAAIPVALLLWLVWKQPRLRIAGNMDAVHSGAARRLIETPGFKVDGIYLTEIIELGEDLLVGYRRGPGDATPFDHASAARPISSGPPDNEEGQMLLPQIVRDQHGMLMVQRWCADHTPLASLTSADLTLFGLLDRPGGAALVVELSPPS